MISFNCIQELSNNYGANGVSANGVSANGME